MRRSISWVDSSSHANIKSVRHTDNETDSELSKDTSSPIHRPCTAPSRSSRSQSVARTSRLTKYVGSSRKSVSSPGQTILEDEPVVEQISTPYYTLSRSRSRIMVELKLASDHCQESNQIKSERKPPVKSERDIEIDHLQQEIDRLTLQLQNEQNSHWDTKQKASVELRDTLGEMKQNHKKYMKNLKQTNAESLDEFRRDLSLELSNCKRQHEAVANELQRQIETIEAQFIAYKSLLTCQLSYDTKLRDAKSHCAIELHSHLYKLRTDLAAKKQLDLAQEGAVYKEKLNQLKCNFTKQIEDLQNRFSDGEEDRKRMQLAEERLKALHTELQNKEDNYRNICLQTDENERHNAELMMKLKLCKESFEERTRQVDVQYANALSDLKLQHIALRSMYLKKCDQAAGDSPENNGDADGNRDTITSLKDLRKALVKTRQRTGTSFMDRGLDPNHRRFSAPATNQEVKLASYDAAELKI